MAFDRDSFLASLIAASKGIWQRAFAGDLSPARALADSLQTAVDDAVEDHLATTATAVIRVAKELTSQVNLNGTVKVEFDTVKLSSGGVSFDSGTSRLLITRTGYYLVGGSLKVSNVPDAEAIELFIKKNGTRDFTLCKAPQTEGAASIVLGGSCLVEIDSITDYLEMFVVGAASNTSDANADTDGGSNFWAMYVAPLNSEVDTGVISPTDLANLKSWWKADAISSLSSGDPVTTWANSFSADDLTGSAGTRPTWVDGVINGKPVVRFDGVDDVLEKTMASTYFSSVQSLTFFVVFKPASTAWGSLLSQDSGGGAAAKWFFDNRCTFSPTAGNSIDFHMNDTLGTDFYFSSDNAYAEDVFQIACFTRERGSLGAADNKTWYKNGVADGVDTTAFSFPSPNTGNLRMGYSEVGSQFAGDIAEIIIYNRCLSDDELDQVGAYLQAKYGITWTP